MVNRTITHREPTYTGTTAGIVFTNGTSAPVDDATLVGKRRIAFAKRQGWAVSDGTAAVDQTPGDGEPVGRWTRAELEAYLNGHRVAFPSGATDEELRDAVRDAFETKAQGGSAANESAGHTSGTIPPEGAPLVSNPAKPDNPDEAAGWQTPQSGNVTNDVAPTISAQPSASPKIAPATATYTVTATGTPAPSYQWQRQTRGAGAYNDIDGATNASYTTPPLSVAENHNDRYRVRVSNSDGVVISASVQQVVTAS